MPGGQKTPTRVASVAQKRTLQSPSVSAKKKCQRAAHAEGKRLREASETAEQKEERLKIRRDRYQAARVLFPARTDAQRDADAKRHRYTRAKESAGQTAVRQLTDALSHTVRRAVQSVNRPTVVPAVKISQQMSAGSYSPALKRGIAKFRCHMASQRHYSCTTCNESFPDIVLDATASCKRCRNDKSQCKRFSIDNNMDPGDVPAELHGLTQVEEMLIVKVACMMQIRPLKGEKICD